MLRVRHSQRHRPSIPLTERFLSKVVAQFLDPIDALFTVFFSILFALLFTLSYEFLIYHGIVLPSSPEGTGKELSITILGAVTAWGIIDGVLYVLTEVMARSERRRLLRYVRDSQSEAEAVAAIANELDFILEPITSDEQRRALYDDVRAHLGRAEPRAVGVTREDVVGAVVTVLLSVLVVLPSLLPLLLLPNNLELAVRVSNVVSLVVIFSAGYSWGLHTGASPWKVGLLLAAVCTAMVLVAMFLGG